MLNEKSLSRYLMKDTDISIFFILTIHILLQLLFSVDIPQSSGSRFPEVGGGGGGVGLNFMS